MLLTGDLENEDKDKEHSTSLQSPNTNVSFYLAYFFLYFLKILIIQCKLNSPHSFLLAFLFHLNIWYLPMLL